MKFWFITGSQMMYGEDTLRQVEADSREIAAGLQLPFPVIYQCTVKSNEEIVNVIREANYDPAQTRRSPSRRPESSGCP